MTVTSAGWEVGTVLPPLELEPISRTDLALFAGGSGDHNTIHLDIDVARAAGMDDVFAQGMLSMAYLARLVTDHVPLVALRELSTRFTAITPVGARPTCTAKVAAVDDGLVTLDLQVALQDGTVTLAGSAVVSLEGLR